MTLVYWPAAILRIHSPFPKSVNYLVLRARECYISNFPHSAEVESGHAKHFRDKQVTK